MPNIPLAPWVKYPNVDPHWGGWRQGLSEAWLLNVWLPFWQSLSSKQKTQFLIETPPPSEHWEMYLSHYWS